MINGIYQELALCQEEVLILKAEINYMELKKTITSIFMVPTLECPKDSLKNNGFINGYINDEERDVQYENAIYLLFQPKNLDKFREFLDEEYERTKSIIEDYDYSNGYVVVVYKLNESLSEDFKLIREGKYSKTSENFQKIFPKNISVENERGKLKDHLSLQYRIFNKTEDLIEFWEDKLGVDLGNVVGSDFEVWEGFDLKRETLNIKNFIKNV
jgi:hypothetical protein